MDNTMKLNSFYCADCIEVLKKMPDNCIDLIVTSPPYNVGIEYESHNDNMKVDEYYLWLKNILKELYRVLKDDGRFALNHYLSCGTPKIRFTPLMDLNHIACEIGFKHHGLAIWNDPTLSKLTAWGSYCSASAPYLSSPYEGILILYKNQWKKQTKGKDSIDPKTFQKLVSGVWNIPTQRETEHPTEFNINLPIYCIQLLSFLEDVVLDPFCGSGTTGIASYKTGRNFICIDNSQKYIDIAKRRYSETISQLDIFKPTNLKEKQLKLL